MTVLLLDERWPTMIPMQAHGKLRGPVYFTGEVPVSVRWNFSDLLVGEDATGTLVSTDEHEPETRARLATGEPVIRAESLADPVMQARRTMATARRIGQWEREQTHTSLLPYLEEESAEFAASEAGASFRIMFVGADQGSGGILAYQQIGEIPPYGHGYLTREVDRATQLPVRLHGDHGGPAFIEQQHSHVHKV